MHYISCIVTRCQVIERIRSSIRYPVKRVLDISNNFSIYVYCNYIARNIASTSRIYGYGRYDLYRRIHVILNRRIDITSVSIFYINLEEGITSQVSERMLVTNNVNKSYTIKACKILPCTTYNVYSYCTISSIKTQFVLNNT